MIENEEEMSVKPSDIFIGVIDFFSVMLPGALLTYFLMGIYYADIFGDGKIFPEPSNDAARWIVFLITSYITGNAVFMLAAFLDLTYDGFPRKRLFQSKYDLPFKTARVIREKHLATGARFEELYAGKDISKSELQTISGVQKLKKTIQRAASFDGSGKIFPSPKMSA